jgi:hypothetical protein
MTRVRYIYIYIYIYPACDDDKTKVLDKFSKIRQLEELVELMRKMRKMKIRAQWHYSPDRRASRRARYRVLASPCAYWA